MDTQPIVCTPIYGHSFTCTHGRAFIHIRGHVYTNIFTPVYGHSFTCTYGRVIMDIYRHVVSRKPEIYTRAYIVIHAHTTQNSIHKSTVVDFNDVYQYATARRWFFIALPSSNLSAKILSFCHLGDRRFKTSNLSAIYFCRVLMRCRRELLSIFHAVLSCDIVQVFRGIAIAVGLPADYFHAWLVDGFTSPIRYYMLGVESMMQSGIARAMG